MNRDFKGIWIPEEILSREDLSTKEKFYLSLIEMGFSEIETDNIMLLGGITSIKHIKSVLYKKHLYTPEKLKIKTANEAKDFVLLHKNEGSVCEWCGERCYVLHKHHYPIPKKFGGTETVNICPNCHSVFHFIFNGGEFDEE